jgi:membrane protein DedA with SNARE-associated domain
VEQFIEFIQKWGYLAVLFGAMIEGESVILTACIMAYLGYLSIAKIVIISFLGTLFADQGLYYVGRLYGQRLINKFPKMQEPAHRAITLLHKWDKWFILSFRFIYGIRIISPVIIGSSGITPRRFIPLNLIAALVWTAVSCTGGYLLGGVIDAIGFEIVEKYVLVISVALLVFVLTIGYHAWKKFHPDTPKPDHE